MQAIETITTNVPDAAVYGQIAAALQTRGWCYMPNAVPPALCSALLQQAQSLDEHELDVAGVGRQAQHQLNDFVRRDRIRWIYGDTAAEREWLQWMEQLRLVLNRQLFLGLFNFESHFARYEPGAFYRKHVDAFKGEANRVVSTVLYLNPDWRSDDGGALVLYAPEEQADLGGSEIGRFMPAFASLAVYLSEDFPHEVLPTRRERNSIAGWFRINTSTADKPDPAL